MTHRFVHAGLHVAGWHLERDGSRLTAVSRWEVRRPSVAEDPVHQAPGNVDTAQQVRDPLGPHVHRVLCPVLLVARHDDARLSRESCLVYLFNEPGEPELLLVVPNGTPENTDQRPATLDSPDLLEVVTRHIVGVVIEVSPSKMMTSIQLGKEDDSDVCDGRN